jgi:hypothetical protein
MFYEMVGRLVAYGAFVGSAVVVGISFWTAIAILRDGPFSITH